MSTQPSGEIYQLIPKVMAEIGAIEKNRKNEQQKYQFRGIEDFYQAAHPAYIKHGIFCVPQVLEHSFTTFEKSNDFGKVTTWRHVTIKVNHQFTASDASHVDVITYGEGLDNSDKATNKAMSAAMKYAVIELFSVPTKDIEDSDRTTPETGRTTAPIKIASPVIKTAQDEGAIKGKTPVQAGETRVEEGKIGPPPSREKLDSAGDPPSTYAFPREPGSDDGDECIDLPKQRALHRAFRDALKSDDSKGAADKLLQTWLQQKGYIANGKGTTKTIPQFLFAEVLKDAVKFAASLP